MFTIGRTSLGALIVFAAATSASVVPEQPSAASLHVISNTELQLDFLPPVSDGGSEVTSYLVEWDTDPGTTEVQTIT